jgi:WD40 repeat protein
VYLSWHSITKRVLAAGVGGKVLLVGVPAEGMEQLEFDLDDDSTPGQHGRQLATAMQNFAGSRSDAAVACVQSGAGISFSVARVLAPVGSTPPSSTAHRCTWVFAAPADASVLPDWSGEAVTCLSFSPDGQLLAVGGAEGTVRVWQLEAAAAADRGPSLRAVHSTAVPVGAGSVGVVRWLPAEGGCVLLTGNRNNSTLQLWHSGVAGGAWVPLQSLSFEGKGGQPEFFNQLDVVPSQQLVVLADTARKAVYTLHYSGGQAGLCQAGLVALHTRAIAS